MEEFAAGALLGPYRIEGVLGAGGMGRVYKAVDTRLDRPVAIKTSDARFTERFALEARAISALNHPHVCTLYDVGPNFLVMELIEGPTLADRLLMGPIEVDEALHIARQIAAALEAAHEKGVVHRDLKPANIRITANGTVKVLDFGLAKRLQRELATVAPGLTETGAVLGTSGYMAPEQLYGQAVDKRADIWAFGVVLYEMLTGERPFGSGAGKTRGFEADGASRSAHQQLPRKVQRLLRSCLKEDPRERLRDIGDVEFLLEDESSAAPAARGPSRRVFAGALAGAAGVTALGTWGWLRSLTATSPTPPRGRFTATLPAGARMFRETVVGPSLALSPDGRLLAIAATDNEGQRLYVRKIDELVATPLTGTAGAKCPFFSPDGAWIGFFANGRLRRVPAEGGAAIDLAAAPGAAAGACWGPDDRIVFGTGWRSALQVVSARGGAAEVLLPVDPQRGDLWWRWVDLLPGGRVAVVAAGGGEDRVIVAVDLESGRRVVLTEGSMARYADGYLLISRGTTLLAAPFDPVGLTLTGAAVPLIDGVANDAAGVQHYAVSRSGTLAYAPGAARHALVLADLVGAEQRVVDEAVTFRRPRFAPNGRTLAAGVARAERGGDDLWIYDVAGLEPGRRLTFDGGTAPVFRPDGSVLGFAGERFWTTREPPGLYTKDIDGSTAEQKLIDLPLFHMTIAWIAAGLVFEVTTDEGEFWIELFANDARRRLVAGSNSRVSADGRWLAYVSDASGSAVIYVMSLQDGAARWQIAEGHDPLWAPDGSELYYLTGTRLMAAKLDMTAGVRVVGQRVVQDSVALPKYGDYDLAPDGRTLALIRPVDPLQGREVVVALSWLAQLTSTRGG